MEAVSSYGGPLAKLTVAFGTEPLMLAAILEANETLQSHANRVF